MIGNPSVMLMPSPNVEFQDRQTLVVEHREHAIGVFEITRLEQSVRRIGTGGVDTQRARLQKRGRDDIDFFSA